ncbi:histidine kinase N-terminal 7TM domain-containing protein [Halopenitus sp. H-Gu1]|uniref:histidine kinase N-terminal 7TM domain-containing protein n=1 Tax=Halopenitus sp. H-Gu1 TaxID=3242697 RepID=UPI00359E1A24
MVEVVTLPWPAIGSLTAGVASLALVPPVSGHRGKPGANWFIAMLIVQAGWCFAYGIGLLVFDPGLRVALETIAWLGIVWTGLIFLAFALEYTGRGDVVWGRGYATFAAMGVIASVLVVTNAHHGAMWTGFELDPVLHSATVSYTLEPAAVLTLGITTLAVVVSVGLLVDTLLSYGPLFRREATAVTLSTLPPGIALLAWAFGIGPVPQLNLAPMLFIPHVVLDAYAFGRGELFARNPTTIRAAERTAIDDLADPIAVVDPEERIARTNGAFDDAFDFDPESGIDRPISSVVGIDRPEVGMEATIERRVDDRQATFAISVSPLSDPSGSHVGYTTIFRDVTERERRRQQLEVLNRILRHNLRNDAGVVHGYAELLVDRLDGENRRMADAIERRSDALAALGEKARTVETLIEGEPPRSVSVVACLERAVADAREEFPEAIVELDRGAGIETDADATAPFPERTLVTAVSTLLENALFHHDGAGTERPDGEGWARVRIDRSDGEFIVRVLDDGPGIPDHEVEAIEAGRETALEHGSGLGLWIVHWASAALGAESTFADRDPRGTIATLRLPVTGVVSGTADEKA